jgi:hypothetical protein
MKVLLDGFELSGITRFQTGRPFTITANALTTGSRRADVISGVPLYLKEDRQWLNPAAFARAPDLRRGNGGVGIVYGPHFLVWDFSARKKIPFNERMNISLQLDLFNAFNRANFSTMGTNAGTFLVQTGAGADGSIAKVDGAFGVLNASGPGRSIQLGAKFVF